MAIATLTTTGQLTVPKKIRDALKQSGDKIEIVLTKGHEAILRPLSKRVDETFSCFIDPDKQKGVSPQGIDDAVKKAMKESSG